MLRRFLALERNRARLGLSSLHPCADAKSALLAYDWPGKVRELEHLIGRSAWRGGLACAEGR